MNNAFNHPTAKLLVCERSGRWAVALRRELAASSVRVWETGTIGECQRELLENAASFVVVELLADNAKSFDAVLRLLTDVHRRFPAARVAVVGEPVASDCEAALREAGAVHVGDSLRRAGLLARLALRHMAGVPRPPQTLTERIRANLPWAKSA